MMPTEDRPPASHPHPTPSAQMPRPVLSAHRLLMYKVGLWDFLQRVDFQGTVSILNA